jgi:hypothetical protein
MDKKGFSAVFWAIFIAALIMLGVAAFMIFRAWGGMR